MGFRRDVVSNYPFLPRCFRKALLDYGIKDSNEHILKEVRITIESAVWVYGKAYGISSKEILSRFQSYNQIPDYRTVRPYPGALDYLSLVTEKGGCNHVYTHRHKEVLAYLKRFGMEPYFASFITEEDGYVPQPSPEALLALMERRSIPRNQLTLTRRETRDARVVSST